MGLKETVKQLWIRKIEKEYEKMLAGKKSSYDTWVHRQEEAERVYAESAADAGQTAYILYVQKNGYLSEHAHTWIADYFAKHPQVQILYGDEDFLTTEGKREKPWYKPCWSPDTYLSQFYVGSVIAVRQESEKSGKCIFFEHPGEIRANLTAYIRKWGGFEKDCRTIARCPHVLFHVREEKVWESYLASAEQQPFMEEMPLLSGRNDDVSVIIPSKDHPDILSKCLDSLKQIPGPEILIVDNGSSEENRDKIQSIVQNINEDEKRMQSVRYLYHPMDFNFSEMCNIGANAAAGKYLLFLNDDIEVCGVEWIHAMKEKASRPYVGAVGLKLYYPEGIRIQHAGITNLPVGPVHKMQFAQDEGSIYFDRNKANMNCLAVTGACMMIEKEKYVCAGGFKDSLRVAYNDVELGFSLYEAGYQNVILNEYHAYHHESLSRGSDESKEKLERLVKEREHLYELHPALRGVDPYYPEGLSKDGLDSRIVPGYVNALNTIQDAVFKEEVLNMEHIREDKCLFLGIEQSTYGQIKGYGVVLGDNNACYDRYVVLERNGSCFIAKAQNTYRQDLEENMKDQHNVALCGFHLQLSSEECTKLAEDTEYRIGVMAVHKINKGKLLNWSGRYFKR